MDTKDVPEELTDKIVAERRTSVCSCKNPVSYRILLKDKLEETNCENFYKFIGNYNSSCDGCILTWKTGCC